MEDMNAFGRIQDGYISVYRSILVTRKGKVHTIIVKD